MQNKADGAVEVSRTIFVLALNLIYVNP